MKWFTRLYAEDEEGATHVIDVEDNNPHKVSRAVEVRLGWKVLWFVVLPVPAALLCVSILFLK